MLKSLFTGAFKSPVKFLALCLAVYIAAHSIFVALLMVGAAFNHFKGSAKKEPRSSDRDHAERQDVAAEALQGTARGQARSARSDMQATTVPQRQYAKSAVVIPMKARPSSATAQTLKTGTK
ncbi:hypothetical protein [Burkholderia sp. BCC0405]|uniref:hypothetical protein n=1 Tax=Burkholderia sp. BCC0405 TaxID=2676298 RepID=UPI00158D2369|nr:hypothetical protein [Burkholderia sp. BCC0405]